MFRATLLQITKVQNQIKGGHIALELQSINFFKE